MGFSAIIRFQVQLTKRVIGSADKKETKENKKKQKETKRKKAKGKEKESQGVQEAQGGGGDSKKGRSQCTCVCQQQLLASCPQCTHSFRLL